MRTILRNIFLSISGSTKSISEGVHILNSHYISRLDASAEIFHNLLTKLNQHADIVKFEEALELIETKQVKNKKCIAFSFDDGFEECYTKIAPVLTNFNTNAAFFINPRFIEGTESYINDFQQNKVHIKKSPMTWKQIKELHQQGFIIGNHTYDHIKLVGLNDNDLNQQIIDSKIKIEEELGSSCKHFAWTYGSMNDIDKEALDIALNEHDYVFSCDNYTQYYSNNNSKIINRRHIEGDWPINHVNYFLSQGKKY